MCDGATKPQPSAIRVVFLTCLLAMSTRSVGAQEVDAAWSPQLSVQASVVPLYGGDATVGRYFGRGPTVRLGVMPRAGRAGVEASFTYLPRDDYNGRPQLRSVSLLAGTWIPSQATWIAGWIGGGVGRLSVRAKDLSGCLPPLCFAEGGGDLRDADLTTLVANIGVALPVAKPIHLRGDLRLHVPVSSTTNAGDSGELRIELAFGLMFKGTHD